MPWWREPRTERQEYPSDCAPITPIDLLAQAEAAPFACQSAYGDDAIAVAIGIASGFT
jgi:hypothetical protein